MTQPDHEHDLRRNPFVVYNVGTSQMEEVVCADPACVFRMLRPIPYTAMAKATWPKVELL